MKKRKIKYHSRSFYLMTFLAVFIVCMFVNLGIILGVTNNMNTTSNTSAIQNKYNEPSDMVQSVLKSRSLSLFFAKKNGLLSYNGTFGSSWVLPQGIVLNNNDTLSCYIATNVHVIGKFIDKQQNKYSLNNEFDSLFISYFDSNDPTKLIGGNISERQFIDKQNISVPFVAINSKDSTDYPLNGIYDLPEFWNYDSLSYVKNSYIDFSILKLTISANDNQTFYNWCKNIYNIDNNLSDSYYDYDFEFITLQELNQLETSSIYIGGFPIVDQRVKWKSFEFNGRIDFTNNYLYDTIGYVTINNDKTNKYTTKVGDKLYKSIASQLLLNSLNMGSGSSGSMVLTKVGNVYKVVGIWWGIYILPNSISGAVDLLFSVKNLNNHKYYPHEWKDYNIVSYLNSERLNG